MAGDRKQTAAVVTGVTLDQVKVLIVEANNELKALLDNALKDLLNREAVVAVVDAKLSQLLTSEQALELIAGQLSTLPTFEQIQEQIGEFQNKIIDYCTTLQPGTTATLGETSGKPPLDPDWLAGLTDVEGEALTPDDVLGYAVAGGTVTITTIAGKKHTVAI